MKAKIFTLLTLMVMTSMSLTSMAQEPILILVEENGDQVNQPSQESSFSFPQEETTTNTTTTEPSLNSSWPPVEEEVLTLILEDEDASAAKAEKARRAEEARLAEEARRAEEARLAEEARRAEEARLAEEARRAEEARLAEEARRAEEARLAEEARRAEEEKAAAQQQAPAQTEQVESIQQMTEEQKLEERIAATEAAEARALEAAAKAEEAAKKATEQREKLEALQNGQGIPTQTNQQQPVVQSTQGSEGVTDTEPVKLSVRERYYKRSGTNFLSVVSLGYSTVFLMPNRMDGLTPTEFAGRRHFINFEILEWRTKLFGMQMLNFEIGVNTPGWTEGGIYLTKLMSGGEINYTGYGSGLKKADARTMWFAYKPTVKFYIPCTDWLAIELYGGIEIDLTTAWSEINPQYYKSNKYIPGRNYFLGAYGGLGLMLTSVPALPIEIKAEYRHPVQGNMDIVPQGFYLSTQLHLGVPIRKTQKNKK